MIILAGTSDMMIFEELAPTRHCKFNKKAHSHGPPLSFQKGHWFEVTLNPPFSGQPILTIINHISTITNHTLTIINHMLTIY